VEDLGGSVKWWKGAYRVNWNLAVSRAVGDRFMRPFVSAAVDMRETEIVPEDGSADSTICPPPLNTHPSRFLCSLAAHRRPAEMNMSDWSSIHRKKMAGYVAEEALRRDSSDNITVVIVWLDAAGTATR